MSRGSPGKVQGRVAEGKGPGESFYGLPDGDILRNALLFSFFKTILALHKKVITHNKRVFVDHEENRVWKLKIRHVQWGDRGCYMCQINTESMMKEIGCIDVRCKASVHYWPFWSLNKLGLF